MLGVSISEGFFFFFWSKLRFAFGLGKLVIRSLACYMVKNLCNGKKLGIGKEKKKVIK
jgi:hypothetical protein